MRCANKNLVFLFFVLLIAGCKPVEENINKGQFKMARKRINREIISNTCDPMRRIELENQKERMWRIEQDFNKSREDILPFIKKYYPDVTAKQLTAWEDEKSLEKMTINGQDRYFVRAAENLFRINSEAKQRKISVDGEKNNLLNIFIGQNIPEIIKDLKTQKDITGKPVHMKFSYTLTVDADAVPGGEIVRCWLPFPREENARQTDVELLSANCSDYVLASNQHLQRTVYMQKPAVKGRPTVFEITFLATMRPQWFNLKNVDILPYNKNAQLYQKYTTERYPHIRFSPAVKALSEKIVGDETDPDIVAKKIFKYVNDAYPWASAREYSTIENIPEYVIENKHGDCGQVTLLFMTLARYNGIPARWQSGWMLHPGSKNLHDWCEIYFEGPGWIPVDQSFGLTNSENEDVHWFYLGGMDAYRLIINDDYAMPLFPKKHYMRSETNDFQRGEVEWKGGNLYFDQWDYHMKIEYVNQ